MPTPETEPAPGGADANAGQENARNQQAPATGGQFEDANAGIAQAEANLQQYIKQQETNAQQSISESIKEIDPSWFKTAAATAQTAVASVEVLEEGAMQALIALEQVANAAILAAIAAKIAVGADPTKVVDAQAEILDAALQATNQAVSQSVTAAGTSVKTAIDGASGLSSS